MLLPPSRPLVLGHRGAPAELPENTLRSFGRAMEHGADGIEFDVQLTRDGVPVVIHDWTLERTTDGRGAVAEASWAELSRLSAGGEPVPRLAEVLAWAERTGAFLDVEIKASAAAPAALRLLEASRLLPRVLVSSFDPEVVAAADRLLPGVRRFLLSEQWHAAARDAVRRCGAEGVCLEDAAATPEALAELAELGLPVAVWTVDEPARIRALLRAGVVGVISNRPERAVAARVEAGVA